eukprot:5924896-Ditylum_brightwellii.AAC.1
MEKAWKKEGWCYMRKSETVWNPSEKILRKILPHDFLLGILRRREEDKEGGLTCDKGNRRSYTAKKNISTVLFIITCLYLDS